MTNLYAVHGVESTFTIIKANSKEEAFNIFANNQIEDENLQDFITSFAVNDGLLEHFYRDDQGSFFENYMNGGPERLQQLNDQERNTYIYSWIERNANQFWNDKPKLATEYLNELYKANQKALNSNEFYVPDFTDDFWINTIKIVIQKINWYEDFDIIEINLTDRDYQQIYP